MSEAKIPVNNTEDLVKPKRVNGRYTIPWGPDIIPSVASAFWWTMTEKNLSGVGGTWKQLWKFKTEKLDKDLPVIKPNYEAIKNPPMDDIQVTWIGHATCLVQMHGLNILTDPIFNNYCGPSRMTSAKRFRPVPCTIEELPKIDAVVISHNHYDHLDHKSVVELNKKFGDAIQWYVGIGQGDWMKNCGCKNVLELDWWEQSVHPETSEDKGVAFVFTPSQHWCRRTATDTNQALWGSWCIIGPKLRFFFGGDTAYCDVFKTIGKTFGPFDLAAIPIGAYHPRWFMKTMHTDPQHAVEMHKDLQAKTSLGIHWGTFALAYEHYLAPWQELQETLREKNIPESEFFVIKLGETKVIDNGIH